MQFDTESCNLLHRHAICYIVMQSDIESCNLIQNHTKQKYARQCKEGMRKKCFQQGGKYFHTEIKKIVYQPKGWKGWIVSYVYRRRVRGFWFYNRRGRDLVWIKGGEAEHLYLRTMKNLMLAWIVLRIFFNS